MEETFDDTGERLNYDNWIPNDKDRPGILADFKSSYDAAVELCGGVDCEDAVEVNEHYESGEDMEDVSMVYDCRLDVGAD